MREDRQRPGRQRRTVRGFITTTDRRCIQGEYHDGKQTGEWTQWYDNGQMKSVDHYKDGIQDGEHTGWYTDGKIAAIGMYKDGKREGVWKRWDPQGFKNWEETYKDDKKIS